MVLYHVHARKSKDKLRVAHALFHKEPEHRQQGQKEVCAEVILQRSLKKVSIYHEFLQDIISDQ